MDDGASTDRRWARPLLLGAGALVIDVAQPLLPLLQDGSSRFSTFVLADFPVRVEVSSFLSLFATAVVVAFGVVMVARGSAAIGAGVFVAMGTLLGVRLAAILLTVDAWFWRSNVYLALEVVETILLFAAAILALREDRGREPA